MTAATPLHPNKRDRGQVETLSGMGATEDFIANHLSISIDDLKLHYAKQLEMGPEEANLRVAQTFFEMATSGEHPAMTLSWIKMRLKWSEAPATTVEEDNTDIELAREKLLKLLNRASK